MRQEQERSGRVARLQGNEWEFSRAIFSLPVVNFEQIELSEDSKLAELTEKLSKHYIQEGWGLEDLLIEKLRRVPQTERSICWIFTHPERTELADRVPDMGSLLKKKSVDRGAGYSRWEGWLKIDPEPIEDWFEGTNYLPTRFLAGYKNIGWKKRNFFKIDDKFYQTGVGWAWMRLTPIDKLIRHREDDLVGVGKKMRQLRKRKHALLREKSQLEKHRGSAEPEKLFPEE